MAKSTVPRGETSVIRHIFIMDSTATTGAGKTGLAHDTASLTGYYIYAGGTKTALTLETIATLGTYAAPTSAAHIRFKEVDATNMPGWYELQFHNDWFSVASARKTACVQLKGATGMSQLNLELDCIGLSIQSDAITTYVSKLAIDVLNKKIITEASGNTEQFNDADVSLGTIAAAYSSDGTYTTRKRMVI